MGNVHSSRPNHSSTSAAIRYLSLLFVVADVEEAPQFEERSLHPYPESANRALHAGGV